MMLPSASVHYSIGEQIARFRQSLYHLALRLLFMASYSTRGGSERPTTSESFDVLHDDLLALMLSSFLPQKLA